MMLTFLDSFQYRATSFQVHWQNWSTPIRENLNDFYRRVLRLECQLVFCQWVRRSISTKFNKIGVGRTLPSSLTQIFSFLFHTRLDQVRVAVRLRREAQRLDRDVRLVVGRRILHRKPVTLTFRLGNSMMKLELHRPSITIVILIWSNVFRSFHG